MMDDEGTGGSPRHSGSESDGLPPSLLQHAYRPRPIPREIDPDRPDRPTRSRSQDHGRSLPSSSYLLPRIEPMLNYGHIISSRSLDASPVNTGFVTNPDLPPPRFATQRPLPPIDDLPHSTRAHSTSGYSYPPMRRSMSTSPYRSHSHSYPNVPRYAREPTPWTPQPLRPLSRQAGPSPGIQDVFIEEVGVMPQPEVPVRPLRDSYPELRHSPGSAQEQRRGRSDLRATHTSRTQRSQTQAQDHRVALEQGHAEGSQRDPQRRTESFPSQSIRERRPPTAYPVNPFEEQQRLQRPQSQSQRQQVHHQPQPRQPARFSQLLSGPGHQGGVGASSSSQSASSSRSQTIPSFAGELYSEGQPEIKPLYQGGSMVEPPAIEMQEAAPERKKAQKSPAVKKKPRTPTEVGGSTSTSTGTTTSTRRKPSTKVTVACDFCRGRKLRCNGERPCSNCSGRGTECTYQPGAPRRRGPGKPKKKEDQEPQQPQQTQQRPLPDQSQMSISAGSPGSSRPLPITSVRTAGITRGGSPLTPGRRMTTGPRFPSQSPGASTSEMETGSQTGSRRRLSGSSVEEPERKRSRIREFEGEGRP